MCGKETVIRFCLFSQDRRKETVRIACSRPNDWQVIGCRSQPFEMCELCVRKANRCRSNRIWCSIWLVKWIGFDFCWCKKQFVSLCRIKEKRRKTFLHGLWLGIDLLIIKIVGEFLLSTTLIKTPIPEKMRKHPLKTTSTKNQNAPSCWSPGTVYLI